jgi:hypothetical protein
MKISLKSLLFLFLTMIFFSCKNAENPNENSSDVNDTNNDVLRETAVISRTTSSLIIIDKTKFANNNELETWLTNNDKFIIKKYSFDPNIIAVDINLMSDDGDENNNATDVAIWLNDNNKYIDFNKTYEFIDENHVVLDGDRINRINSTVKKLKLNSVVKDSITLDELVKEIDRQAKAMNPSEKYNDLYYPFYVNFSIDTSGTVVDFKLKKGYLTNDVSLSIPAIKSIIYHNKISQTDLSKYHVKYAYERNTSSGTVTDQIALTIYSETTKRTKFYNYSTDPTKKTTVKSRKYYNAY